jgi:hypothetical protein
MFEYTYARLPDAYINQRDEALAARHE